MKTTIVEDGLIYEVVTLEDGNTARSLVGVENPPPIEPYTPQPTLEQQIQALKQDNLILMDAIATMFEEILILRGE